MNECRDCRYLTGFSCGMIGNYSPCDVLASGMKCNHYISINQEKMNAKQFFDRVALMREAQKQYFKKRTMDALRRSMALEKEIDEEIARVNLIMTPK